MKNHLSRFVALSAMLGLAACGGSSTPQNLGTQAPVVSAAPSPAPVQSPTPTPAPVSSPTPSPAPAPAPASSPLIQLGDDWTLPAWVKASATGGCYGCGDTIEEVQLGWRDIEPQEGVFNWSLLQSRVKNASGFLWLRFFASDTAHLPQWLKAKYPDLQPLRYRWPDSPYRDIYGWPGTDLAGDFYPIWDPRIEAQWRRVMQSLEKSGLAKDPKVRFAYFPHGWRWSEYSVKWVPEMINAGFTPEDYVSWFQRMTQDYAAAIGANKLVFTGASKSEWIESLAGINETAWKRWQTVLNPPTGGNVLSQSALRLGTGARDGFTEVYNGFADAPDWGTSLKRIGKYRYSVVDEDHPLIKDSTRVFNTENEDFQFLWLDASGKPTVNTYQHVKMASLATLRLRMRSQFAGDPKVPGVAPLYEYSRLSMGRQISDSPDAWAALRQYARAPNDIALNPDGSQDTAEDIRNFERWLYQRECAGGETTATERVVPPKAFLDTNGSAFEALRTDQASGNTAICFNLDDRFLKANAKPLQVKVTYLDDVAGTWLLEYDGADSANQRTLEVIKTGDGQWKTATFALSDALFANRQADGADFRLLAINSNLTVRFVRVVRLEETR